METPWQRAKQARSTQQEKAFAKSRGGAPGLNSGRLWFAKRDTIKYAFRVENRTTEGFTHRIDARELEKLVQDAYFHGAIPAMNFAWPKYRQDWMLIRTKDVEEMQERILELEALVNDLEKDAD